MESDIVFKHFEEMFNNIPTERLNLSPSEYAEKFRTLTSDVSTIQGKFKYAMTPYLREIVDTLSPYHPAKIIAVMKGAQIGFTEGVIVNGILWIISQNPGNVLALSANDDLSKEMVESRLDQGIESCGIRHLIRPNTIRKRNQRTGDTSKYKEYAGGRLFAGGLKSIDKLGKQRSIKYGFFDDWDSSEISDKRQGNIFELLQQRFSTSANSMKQFYISTPETKPSNIEAVYEMGDQRKWHVPCPLCGEYIELVWHGTHEDKSKYGITFKKTEEDELVRDSVGYTCQKCGGFFRERHKYKINLNGRWIPTAKPEKPGNYSYHISCLASAPNMYDWTHYAHQYLKTYRDGRIIQSKLKVFNNLVLGIPWEEKQESIKANRLSQNTRRYDIGIVPADLSKKDGNGDIILLTCSCDLNGTLDDARMDWEVVGHAASGSVYSIEHGSIGTYQPGNKDPKRQRWTYRNGERDNVWDYFYDAVVNADWNTEDGRTMKVMITGVDTGYYTHYAYGFIDSYPGRVVGLKGAVERKMQKTNIDLPKWKMARERPNLYILETDLIKDELAEMISLRWAASDEKPQPPGFINFPIPDHKDRKYDRRYFKQYEAEEKKIETDDDGEPIGWKWVRKHSTTANHFFDCAVYNLALRKIISSNIMKELGKKHSTWAEFADVINNL
jgi:phage terminase large subunit GpA-like protein